MLELITSVEIGVVSGVALPHFPKDLQPALAQTAQGASVGFAALPELIVVNRSPRTGVSTQVRPQMDGVTQGLAAMLTDQNLRDLAGLIADRSCSRQTLQTAGIGEAGTV